jgi:hypothetical protein
LFKWRSFNCHLMFCQNLYIYWNNIIMQISISFIYNMHLILLLLWICLLLLPGTLMDVLGWIVSLSLPSCLIIKKIHKDKSNSFLTGQFLNRPTFHGREVCLNGIFLRNYTRYVSLIYIFITNKRSQLFFVSITEFDF